MYKYKNPLTKEDVLNYANINNYDLKEKIKEEESRLTGLFLESRTSLDEFYKNVMLDYSKEIVAFIEQDYKNILNDNIIDKLRNLSIIYKDKDKFPKISKNGKKPEAYASYEKGEVYFPSLSSIRDINKTNEEENIIKLIRKQEQVLIHEIFHLVSKNSFDKQEFKYNDEQIGEYKPGILFTEAVVEKSARDFATKHNLFYHPDLSYMPYVQSLEKFMEIYGIQNNSQLFDVPFDKIIQIASEEEQQQYYDFETNHILQSYGRTDLISEKSKSR